MKITTEIIQYCKSHLKKNGHLYLELDPKRINILFNQIENIKEVERIKIFKDIFGKERFVQMKFN